MLHSACRSWGNAFCCYLLFKLAKEKENIKINIMSLFDKYSENNNLRMSQIGKPDRQVWYQSRDITKEKLPAWAKIKFTYGHILEELLLLLAKTAGHEVKNEQKELEIEGVMGHQDCEIDGVVVDCKSVGYVPPSDKEPVEKLK